MANKTTYEYQMEYLKYLYLFIKIIHYLEIDKDHEILLKRADRMGIQTTYHIVRDNDFLTKKRMISNRLNRFYYKKHDFKTDFYKAATSTIDYYLSKDLDDSMTTKNRIYEGIHNDEYDTSWTIDTIRNSFRGRERVLDETSSHILNDKSIGRLTNKPIDFLLAAIVSRKTSRKNFDNCMDLLAMITFGGYTATDLLEQEDLNIAQLLITPNNSESDYKEKDHLLLEKMRVLNRIIIIDRKEKLQLNKNKGVAETIVNRLRYYKGDEIDLTLVSIIRNVFERDRYSMLDINNGVNFIEIFEAIKDKNESIKDILTIMATEKNFKKQVTNSRDYESLKKQAENYIKFLKRNNIDVDTNYLYKLKNGSF